MNIQNIFFVEDFDSADHAEQAALDNVEYLRSCGTSARIMDKTECLTIGDWVYEDEISGGFYAVTISC